MRVPEGPIAGKSLESISVPSLDHSLPKAESTLSVTTPTGINLRRELLVSCLGLLFSVFSVTTTSRATARARILFKPASDFTVHTQCARIIAPYL